ncbi:MAG: phenylalanine--tRNA ligase subunit alpha [Candidatus Omnitrophota bacterium]
MEEEIKQIQQEAVTAIEQAANFEELEAKRVEYLGRRGKVAMLFAKLGTVPPEKKPEFGRQLNTLKNCIAKAHQEKIQGLNISRAFAKDIDITLPGTGEECGSVHPLTQVSRDIGDIFTGLGFSIIEGPEIETEFNNFEALNIPLDHPSRDTFDTFYLSNSKLLLRSHTSPVQIRVMKKTKPPLAVIVPGKVYRPDAVDASHSFMFHQVEGLVVDDDIKFSDLKGILSVFVQRFFGQDTRMRFRPHFFPFTEPSAEVDISCIICKSKGCRVCSHKGWLEVLGAGMVNPKVFENVGYNPDKVTGFAFGMGVERMAMLKFGIDDIRIFFDNDLRFLKQFC